MQTKMANILIGLFLYTLSPSALWAQDETPDYELRFGRVHINNASDQALSDIEEIDDKEDKEIVLGEALSIADFEEICKRLPWITNLVIERGNATINTINPLRHLKNLERIKVTSLEASKENPIDLTPLAGLVQLREVDFYGTKVTNTDALRNLSNLEKVSFYMSGVDDIGFLEGTPGVTNLSLYGFGHTFDSYEPVSRLENLEELDIYMNKQATDENLEVLKALTSLKTIHMANLKQVTSMDFLENCHQMRNVRAMWVNQLDDISAFENMDSLVTVNIKDSGIDSLEVLRGKEKLVDLDVSGTAVADLSPISASTKLSRIDISQTNISDVSPLFNNENMRWIVLDAHVPEAQVEELKRLYPDARIQVVE